MNLRISMLAGMMLLLVVPALMSQAGMQGSRDRGGRNYNPATEITAKGTVEEVTRTAGRRGWAGTHRTLKTDQGVYDVHVGPASYIFAQGFAFAKGETAEVTGSVSELSDRLCSPTTSPREIDVSGLISS